ncbi:MAG: glutamate synthase [Clostridiales bacterium]|jgi:glutamate synthase domain-containing protein 3|nr:glutamate synthase [Clostridiales bacterium]
MIIQAGGKHFHPLNEEIRAAADDHITVKQCLGQRYIGCGLSGKTLTIEGTPGNALGAYLDGCRITVKGNAQDATGDTMNDGVIVIRGSAGDATGYAMRGGKIYVRGNTGYRAGIHMKSYRDKIPLLLVGGCAGSFLGEYQAGGVIVVLGLGRPPEEPIVGHFCGTGMHGGHIYLRCSEPPRDLPVQVSVRPAQEEDMTVIEDCLREYCATFDLDYDTIRRHPFLVLRPNTKNPYKRLYTSN